MEKVLVIKLFFKLKTREEKEIMKVLLKEHLKKETYIRIVEPKSNSEIAVGLAAIVEEQEILEKKEKLDLILEKTYRKTKNYLEVKNLLSNFGDEL